jgi:hypothetical protein
LSNMALIALYRTLSISPFPSRASCIVYFGEIQAT